MIYSGVDEYSYVDINGNEWPVKEMREPKSFAILRDVEIGPARAMDELAVRPDVYGSGGEMLAYKLYDANKATILERGFTLAGMNTVKAPVEL